MRRSMFADDPFFHGMADMEEMMSMQRSRMDPFLHHSYGQRRIAEPNNMAMAPFGMFGGGMFGSSGLFGGMESMMRNMPSSMSMMQSSQGAPGSSFQSSFTSVSYGNGGGQPRVYQTSSSTKVGPNGIKETQNSERNSVTGVQKMAIGHHIGERSHVIEKSKNAKTGDEEESQEFINLEEDDADNFNQEWKQRVRTTPPSHRSLPHHSARRHTPYGHHRPEPAAIEYHHPNPSARSQRNSRRKEHQ